MKNILQKRKVKFSNMCKSSEYDIHPSHHQCFKFSKFSVKMGQLNEILDCNDVRTCLKMFKTG